MFHLQTTPQGVYVAPSGARVIEVHPSLPGDDRECSPSRVRVHGLSHGSGAVIFEVPNLDGVQVATLDSQWAEDVAEWAEEFARPRPAWEEAQEEWEAQWEERLESWEEGMEARPRRWNEFEGFDDGLLRGVRGSRVRGPLRRDGREPAEIVRSLFQPMREFGAQLANDAGDSSLFRVVSDQPFTSENLRSAIDELRGEVDGVRSALRDLKVKIGSSSMQPR